MKCYKIFSDKESKMLKVTFFGRLQYEQYDGYFEEYAKHLDSMNPEETTLILELSRLAIELPNTVNKLRPIARLYRDTGFKSIVVRVNKPQKVLKEHLECLIELENIDNMCVVFNV